jgi:hypothetical protein
MSVDQIFKVLLKNPIFARTRRGKRRKPKLSSERSQVACSRGGEWTCSWIS